MSNANICMGGLSYLYRTKDVCPKHSLIRGFYAGRDITLGLPITKVC